MVLLLELLDVLRGGPARTRLEQAAAGDERDDGQHLRRRAELHDGEEVGEVVTQDVARDGDRVLAGADPVDGQPARLDRAHDADVQAVGVVVAEGVLDAGLHVPVVGALRVEPEHGRPAGLAGPVDGELDPVADRDVLGLAGAPDVALLDLVLHEDLPGAVEDLHAAGVGDGEGLVVGAVLLGLLRHEADVRDRAHRRRVEGAVRAAVVDDDLVDPGVGGVRDDREGVLGLVVAVPHLPGVADHRGHGGVDDDVGGHVEVRDPLCEFT